MADLTDPIAYHLVPIAAWEAAPGDEPFRAASLEDEGFVHLTHRMADLVDVANRYYGDGDEAYVVLTIALRWLSSPWRYDGDSRYPHVYGPLDRAAITEVRPILRTPDGTFMPIERPDNRVPPDMPALLRHLVDGGVRFVVAGTSGAALLGAAIEPGDLDICPAVDEANLERLAIVLDGLGARPRVAVPGWVTPDEAAAYRPEPTVSSLDYLFETQLGDLDILARPLGPLGPAGRAPETSLSYDRLVDRAVRVDVAGVAVLVASPSDLLASKADARRPKDLRVRGELEKLVEAHD